MISRYKIDRALDRTVKEFPLLAHAKPNAPGAQYRIVIAATDAIQTSALRDALAGLSLFLIPNQMQWSFRLKAEVYDTNRLVGTYESEGQCDIKEHLLFLLLSPSTSHTPAQVREDTFRDLFIQVERDGAKLFTTNPGGVHF